MNQKDLNEKEYRLQKSYIHENVNKDSLWSGDFYQKLFTGSFNKAFGSNSIM